MLAKRRYEHDGQKYKKFMKESLSTQPQGMWKIVKESTKDNVSAITLRHDDDFFSNPVDVNIFASHSRSCFSANDTQLVVKLGYQ